MLLPGGRVSSWSRASSTCSHGARSSREEAVFKGRSPVVAVFNRSSSREEDAHGAPMVLKSTHVAQMQSTFGGLLECAPTALQHPAYVATPCHQA